MNIPRGHRAGLWAILLSVVIASSGLAATLRQGVVDPEINNYCVESVSLLPRPGESSEKKIQPCRAQLGDEIELYVKNLDLWLHDLRQSAVPEIVIPTDKETMKKLVDENLGNLCLVLNGHPLPTVRVSSPVYRDPTRPQVLPPGVVPSEIGPIKRPNVYDTIRFRLKRDPASEESRGDWSDVLRSTRGRARMEVTIAHLPVGATIGDALTTWVRPAEESPGRQFSFDRLPMDLWMAMGIAVIGLAFLGFVLLARYTTLIRETSLPPCEDGLPPYSLGRAQMSFWFFLVAGAFFFLWLVTGRGDLDTINSHTLALIGISAATGLGAAVITANGPGNPAPEASRLPTLGEQINAARRRIRYLSERRVRARPPAEQEATTREIERLAADLKAHEVRLADWKAQHRNRFVMDLLTEGNTIMFHRFQIVVWTLLLGVIFLSEVWTQLAMPRFDNTLLMLMGISSGTYLGFKIPAANAVPSR